MSEVTLWRGDCLEFMRGMEAGSVDAILTDLPYGTTACSWDAIIPFVPMWAEVKRILKPRGVFVTTASQPFTSKLVMSNLEWFKYEWVWEKSISANFMNAKLRPLVKHENVIVFSPGATANGSDRNMLYIPQGIKKTNTRWKRPQKYPSEHNFVRPSHALDRVIEFSDYPGSIIYFENGNNLTVHPTQKPVALYEYLIRTYTNPDDTVLDFCFGSGTTGVACVQLGLNFIGCELDPGYFAIAERRIAQAQAQPRLFQDEPQKPKPEQQSFL